MYDDCKYSAIDSYQTGDLSSKTFDSGYNHQHPKLIDKLSSDEKHLTTDTNPIDEHHSEIVAYNDKHTYISDDENYSTN